MYLLKKSTRQIKRSFALILALVMITAAAFYTAATATVSPANSTVAENNATPKNYSAIQNWNGVTNNPDDNIFTYEFATDNENLNWDYMSIKAWDYWYTGNTDYTNFTNMTEEVWNANGFKATTFQHICGIGPKGYMRVWNASDVLSKIDTNPSVALTYQPNMDKEYVEISAHKVSLFATYFTKEKGYKALIRITKNGENVYPESGYLEISETSTSVSIPKIALELAEGDILRFEMTCDAPITQASGDNIGISWNPTLNVRGAGYLYTETDDVYNGLTAFMYEYFQSKTADTMTATDSLTLAKENAKRSKYGVYTVYDSIYSGGIIPSDDSSVWKYAVLSEIPSGFEIPSADYALSGTSAENGTVIAWDGTISSGITAVKVLTDGKSYTYMVADKQTSITVPHSTEKPITVQLSGENGASEIIKISADASTVIADKDSANSITYLTDCAKSGSGISSKYTLSSSECESSYGFFYATNAVTSEAAAESYRRTVIYNAKSGEQMMFGFTTPQSGEYEITAPIKVSNDANVFYSILKQDEKGVFTVIDGIRSYADDKSGFVSLVALKAGETVWLNASSNADCEIHIGIPSITLKEDTTDSDGVTAYKYRAVDYVESSAFNKRTYNSGSLTDKSGAVWEFGSFENPIETVDGVTDYDTLGYTDLAVGDDASAVTSQFKPYEIIRGGTWYNSLTMVVASDNTIVATDASGKTGVLYAFLGTNADQRGSIGLPYQSKGFMINVGVGTGKDKVSHNMGIYMKFTAPSSGNITLNLSDFAQAKTLTRVLVLKGDEVVATYGTIPKGTVVDLGYMSKGETAYICYGTNSGFYLSYGGFPIATVSGEKYTLSTDNGSVYTADSADYTVTDSEKITLSDYSSKIGKLVSDWKTKAGESYESGTVYTVSGDDSLTAVYNWLGDITKDNTINAQDISAMRQLLLNNKKSVLADVTSDDSVNLKDLVRMKKWLAGYTVAFEER